MSYTDLSFANRTAQRGLIALMTLVLCFAFLQAQQRWQDAYDSAMKSIERKNWELAEAKLKQARAQNPSQGHRVLFYGTRRETYLPDYYLAIVYMNTQRYQQALTLFTELERVGLVKPGDQEFAALNTSVQLAKSEIEKARLAKGPQSGEASPPRSDAGASGRAATPPQAQSDINTTLQDVSRLLREASSALAARRFTDARRLVGEARQLAGGADVARVNALEREVDLGELEDNARQSIARREWQQAGALTDRLAASDPNRASVAGFRAAIRQGSVVDAERAAMSAFYSGDYQKTLIILERSEAAGLTSSRIYFYMACANAALALLEGSNGDVRLRKARSQFSSSNPRQRELLIDRRFVSPAVLSALQNNAIASRQTSAAR